LGAIFKVKSSNIVLSEAGSCFQAQAELLKTNSFAVIALIYVSPGTGSARLRVIKK
jgi:hypothetical protein